MPRPTASLLVVLVATSLVVTAALGWFGWRLLEQQRDLDARFIAEQTEAAANAIASGIRGSLADAGEQLSAWLSTPSGKPPSIADSIVFALGPAGPIVEPAGSLPFVPVVLSSQSTSSAFVEAESAEFAAARPSVAADLYRRLARSSDAALRAGALLRLGRVLRKSGDLQDAIEASRQLTRLGMLQVEGIPAELAGLDGERLAFRQRGDRANEQRISDRIQHGLDDGCWLLPRATAEFYRDEVSRAPRPDSWLLAAALGDVWSADGNGALSARGHKILDGSPRAIVVLWRASGPSAAAAVSFAARFFSAATMTGMEWSLTDADDRRLVGPIEGAPADAVTRVVGGAESPWTLRVWASRPAPAIVAGRRPMLLAAMAAMLLVVWGATYFMGRAMLREAKVARLQSDFVAAVSHEFRSPLTTMRQMTDMLAQGRVPGEQRRGQYYSMLGAEVSRLQRLVETLLDFGRMEAGGDRYTLTPIGVDALIADAVADLQAHGADVSRIEISSTDLPHPLKGDEDALRLALRNLIDNAIKYSPGPSTVRVRWDAEGDRAAIHVIDEGPGIARDEQAAIFRKFVRGRAARDAHVHGTGVGLAMVRHIVSAHGGEIRLTSEVDRGSTFTLLLPMAADAGEAPSRAGPARTHSPS